MRGYCPRCREYRSNTGEDAWGIERSEFGMKCEKCGAVVDGKE